ncbi:sigma factor-like helix-turn-helix DNA-binding protein (plasmid) [Klebsiella sp. WOUb02]|uniref:sigma factor-like helix-turn-helix DNA-binding protein n=1 Tax=Klebsiella sp. WOUb02 TaxID=3161071 RepID=UPI003CE7B33C
MDRIESQKLSQSEFFRNLQGLVRFSDQPTCLRLRCGNFLCRNSSFDHAFLKSVDFNHWFESIEINTSLRLSALEAEIYADNKFVFVEENLSINGFRWDVIIEKIFYMNTEATVWKFCHIRRGAFLMSPRNTQFINQINDFKMAISLLNDVQHETFALYILGASHQCISQVLNISVGTSKNRINRILALLPEQIRDDVFILAFASGVVVSLFRTANELLCRNVTKMLNK